MWWYDQAEPEEQYDSHYWLFRYSQHDYHVLQWRSHQTREFLESIGFRAAPPPRMMRREDIVVQPLSKPVPLSMSMRFDPKTA